MNLSETGAGDREAGRGYCSSHREITRLFSYKAIQPISSYPTREHNKGGFCEGKRFVQVQCVRYRLFAVEKGTAAGTIFSESDRITFEYVVRRRFEPGDFAGLTTYWTTICQPARCEFSYYFRRGFIQIYFFGEL